MAAKTLKNSNGLQTVTFKTSQKGKKTKIRKEKSIVACSVALVMAFFLAENENRQLEDLPQAGFGRVPEMTENFMNRNYTHCFIRHSERFPQHNRKTVHGKMLISILCNRQCYWFAILRELTRVILIYIPPSLSNNPKIVLPFEQRRKGGGGRSNSS